MVIATPPYYHPHHLEAAVAAANVYLEKRSPWTCPVQ
jgi:hypothetical protein